MSSEGIFTKIKNVLNKPIGTKAPKKAKTSKTKNQDVRPTVAGEASVLQEGVGKSGKLFVYLIVALLAVGALCGVLAFTRPTPAPPKAQTIGVKSENQAAGAYASEALGAWLSATSDDHSAMDNYFSDGGQGLNAKTATEYKDLTVASVDDAGHGITTVKLSASIKTTSKGSGKDQKTTWTPYWYQLAIKTDGDKMRALALPTPIAAPETGDQISLDYSKRVTDQELNKTVQDFMNAYAAGQGDVTRYTSPESNITAISPAYFASTKVKSLSSKDDLKDGTPANGDTAEVLVQTTMTRDNSSKSTQYVLSLKARDGRWEVERIDSAPVLAK